LDAACIQQAIQERKKSLTPLLKDPFNQAGPAATIAVLEDNKNADPRHDQRRHSHARRMPCRRAHGQDGHAAGRVRPGPLRGRHTFFRTGSICGQSPRCPAVIMIGMGLRSCSTAGRGLAVSSATRASQPVMDRFAEESSRRFLSQSLGFRPWLHIDRHGTPSSRGSGPTRSRPSRRPVTCD
jgi:hypothetical protein